MNNVDFTKVLEHDEKVHWQGQPIQGIIFSKYDIFLIPLSLIWCGFIIFWGWSIISLGAPPLFIIVGILLLLAGIYVVIGRFIHDTIRRAHTSYAITNRRIIIQSHGKRVSIALGEWSSLKMEEFPDGTGSIKFAEGGVSPFDSRGFGGWLPSFQGVPCFFRIQQVRDVYNLLSKPPVM